VKGNHQKKCVFGGSTQGNAEKKRKPRWDPHGLWGPRVLPSRMGIVASKRVASKHTEKKSKRGLKASKENRGLSPSLEQTTVHKAERAPNASRTENKASGTNTKPKQSMAHRPRKKQPVAQ